MLFRIFISAILACAAPALGATETPVPVMAVEDVAVATIVETPVMTPPDSIDIAPIEAMRPLRARPARISIYELPYSRTAKSYNWPRLWVNTGILVGAYVGTLVVLECLPEDATSWNRANLQKDPPAKRWVSNVFRRGPEWDHDNVIFNYVLHPYAGAVYFMRALVRVQFLSEPSLLRAHFHRWLGIRHRSLHGATIHSGYIRNAACRMCHRRAVLQTQTQYRCRRIPPLRLARNRQYSGFPHRPRQRSRGLLRPQRHSPPRHRRQETPGRHILAHPHDRARHCRFQPRLHILTPPQFTIVLQNG